MRFRGGGLGGRWEKEAHLERGRVLLTGSVRGGSFLVPVLAADLNLLGVGDRPLR